MREDQASRTAFRVAMRRAVHQLIDIPKVFDDPLALSILGHNLKLESEKNSNPASRSLRAFLAVRSRYAEDRLALAFKQGTDQCVILGAGLDTFAFRNPYPGMRVYEVDHPATQEMKRHLLEGAGIAIPDSMTFVPVNFEMESVSDGLSRAGLRFDKKTFFTWLGVVPYLTLDAVMGTFKLISALPSGSEVVFDYAIPPSSMSFLERMGFNVLARRVAAAGEPFQTFFDPALLQKQLAVLGFVRFEDISSPEINARYFNNREDGLCVGGNVAHLMNAQN